MVTGANRGIGQAIAAGLAERGLRVLLSARDPDAAAEALGRPLGRQLLDANNRTQAMELLFGPRGRRHQSMPTPRAWRRRLPKLGSSPSAMATAATWSCERSRVRSEMELIRGYAPSSAGVGTG